MTPFLVLCVSERAASLLVHLKGKHTDNPSSQSLHIQVMYGSLPICALSFYFISIWKQWTETSTVLKVKPFDCCIIGYIKILSFLVWYWLSWVIIGRGCYDTFFCLRWQRWRPHREPGWSLRRFVLTPMYLLPNTFLTTQGMHHLIQTGTNKKSSVVHRDHRWDWFQ